MMLLQWHVRVLQEQGRASSAGRCPSLLRAIVAAYGRPYLLLGVLKAVSDALSFAGPMLLNLLLRHLGAAAPAGAAGASSATLRTLGWEMDVAAPMFGYACAALLAASLVLKVRPHAEQGSRPERVCAAYLCTLLPSHSTGLCSHARLSLLQGHVSPALPPLQAFLGAQYDYRRTLISSQLRSAVTAGPLPAFLKDEHSCSLARMLGFRRSRVCR